MDADSRWKKYRFLGRSQRDLEELARSLRVFRFVRRKGGHSIEGDSLLAVARYSGEADLEAFLATLGVRLHRVPKDAQDPIRGNRYSHQEWAEFPSRIPGFGHLEQPKARSIAGAEVFLWVRPDGVHLRIPSGRYDVTAEDVAFAQRLEALLAPQLDRFVDPPQDDKYCVCPRYYPEFFR